MNGRMSKRLRTAARKLSITTEAREVIMTGAAIKKRNRGTSLAASMMVPKDDTVKKLNDSKYYRFTDDVDVDHYHRLKQIYTRHGADAAAKYAGAVERRAAETRKAGFKQQFFEIETPIAQKKRVA